MADAAAAWCNQIGAAECLRRINVGVRARGLYDDGVEAERGRPVELNAFTAFFQQNIEYRHRIVGILRPAGNHPRRIVRERVAHIARRIGVVLEPEQRTQIQEIRIGPFEHGGRVEVQTTRIAINLIQPRRNRCGSLESYEPHGHEEHRPQHDRNPFLCHRHVSSLSSPSKLILVRTSGVHRSLALCPSSRPGISSHAAHHENDLPGWAGRVEFSRCLNERHATTHTIGFSVPHATKRWSSFHTPPVHVHPIPVPLPTPAASMGELLSHSIHPIEVGRNPPPNSSFGRPRTALPCGSAPTSMTQYCAPVKIP